MTNEKQLIKQILKGDSSSFTHFVDTYQDMALTIAFRLVANKQEAEDVVQNAFVKAYHNLHTYRLSSKFSTWFYRIVYNTALTAYNKNKVRSETYNLDGNEVDLKTTASSSTLALEEQEQKEIVENAVQQLPKMEAIIVTLYYLEDYSISEIAEIMSLTKSNIKIKLFRARKKLEDILK